MEAQAMRLRSKALVAALFALAALPAFAQQATLNSQETYTISATNVKVQSVSISAAGASIAVEYQAADTSVKRVATYAASSAELTSFLTALTSVRASETGGIARKCNYRVLGWLADNSKFTDPSGAVITVTVVP